MFDLSQFYSYCRQNQVDVIPYVGMPAQGATIHKDVLPKRERKVSLVSAVSDHQH